MWFDRSFEKARVNNGQYTNSKLHIRKKEARKAEYILNVGRCCKDSLKPDITKKKKKNLNNYNTYCQAVKSSGKLI